MIMGLLGKIFGKENVRFPSGRDVEKAEAKIEAQEWKQKQKDVYQKAYREARLKRMQEQGRRAGSVTWEDRLCSFAGASSKPRRSVSGGRVYRVKNNYNPFGSSFDPGW